MAEGFFKRRNTYKPEPNATRRFFYDSQRKWEKYKKNSINMKYLNADRRANYFRKVENEILEIYNAGNRFWKSDVTKLIKMHPDYRNEIYAGTQVCKIINLNDGKFPEEQSLQAMLICNYSAPRLDIDKNPFQYEDFFEERFNSFSDQKKLGLFMVCQVNQNIYLYKNCLTKFWMNRY